MDIIGFQEDTPAYRAHLELMIKRLFKLQSEQLAELHEFQMKALETEPSKKTKVSRKRKPNEGLLASEVKRVLNTALQDFQEDPVERPAITERVARLQEIRDMGDRPATPCFHRPHPWTGFREVEGFHYIKRKKRRRL
eukprot:TRINITY_DN27591_c0_g1_i1.p1 TRINITY_DN27591_c0_g1~~TRINITY_DN27591_c0_g1_i1.p1  ORF type:complete len:150 (+),score=25.79 TRINITY_DN27591_c0_g1_i1:39-452(+)